MGLRWPDAETLSGNAGGISTVTLSQHESKQHFRNKKDTMDKSRYQCEISSVSQTRERPRESDLTPEKKTSVTFHVEFQKRSQQCHLPRHQ